MSFRKAALCYIQSQHFTKVQEVLRPCPQDQAATQYLNFMAALYQNKAEAGMAYKLGSCRLKLIYPAIQAIDNIRRCPDLQPFQLQLIVYVTSSWSFDLSSSVQVIGGRSGEPASAH
jgi:hypothetical protein